MLTLILVVLVLLGFHWVKDKLKCRFGFHEWTMTRGYDEPHHTAVCKRCGAKPKEYK